MIKFVDNVFSLNFLLDSDVQSMYPTTFKVLKARPEKAVEWITGHDRYDEYPYSAHLGGSQVYFPINPEIIAWCSQTFNGGSWHSLGRMVRFKNETDMTMFVLKWS